MALSHHDHMETPKPPFWKRLAKLKCGAGKRLFWAWVAYQAVKGIATTSLIWIPLLYALWSS